MLSLLTPRMSDVYTLYFTSFSEAALHPVKKHSITWNYYQSQNPISGLSPHQRICTNTVVVNLEKARHRRSRAESFGGQPQTSCTAVGRTFGSLTALYAFCSYMPRIYMLILVGHDCTPRN